jgi:predicted enzyme related to lactoylglutathione lyase
MSDGTPHTAGSIVWSDLTVADADAVRAFYEAVVGWRSSPVEMGGYQDYGMAEPGRGQVVAGVCHARGENADLPPQWLIYVAVDDLDASLATCVARGGSVINGPRSLGAYGRSAVIRDPAGAALALIEPPRGIETGPTP